MTQLEGTAYTHLVDRLIQSLCILPGVGPRSAQRMAFYLLQRRRQDGLELSETLQQALTRVAQCCRCRTFSENELCAICANPKRDHSLLCIVESPIDILAIERTQNYAGRYFTLMGHLSPIDGLGPDEIGIQDLNDLLQKEQSELHEVIIATNPTVEGETTAHYLASLIHTKAPGIKCTRIASGVPFGGELEYTDNYTLLQALAGRIEIKIEL